MNVYKSNIIKRIGLTPLRKKIIIDSGLNIIATAVPLMMLQLVILPGVNEAAGSERYGLIVTIVGIFTLVTSTLAGTLNNVRLILDNEYREAGISGDFNLVQVVFSLPCILLVCITSYFYYGNFDVNQMIGIAVVSLLVLMDGYYSVGFRLQIDYRRILVERCLQTIGYFIGYLLFLHDGYWLWIYMIGYAFDVGYVLLKTDLIKEPWKRTPFLKKVIEKEVILIIASFIGGLASYIDKLLIYPLMGGTVTSIYYVATIIGKGISLMVFPISGVLLSYFSKIKSIDSSAVRYMAIFGWIAGAVAYMLCLIISEPLLSFLYNDLVEEAMKYVPVTLVQAVIGVQCTIISPVVLRYCSTKWQMIISSVNVITYLIASIALFKMMGLMGFCIGGVIAALIKYFMMIGIYNLEKNKDCKEKNLV